MRIKDLKPGDKVWYAAHRVDLQNGRGTLVEVVELGRRFTVARQPCGPVIVKSKIDHAYETQVVIKFPVENRRSLQRFLGENKPAQFKLLNSAGRYLMSETEHVVLREARESRELERDAHLELGQRLVNDIVAQVTKHLQEIGVPSGLVRVSVGRHWERDPLLKMVSATLDDDAVRKFLKGDRKLDQLLRDRATWQRKPTPGVDCAL